MAGFHDFTKMAKAAESLPRKGELHRASEPRQMNARKWLKLAQESWAAAERSGDAAWMKEAESNLRFWEEECGVSA